MTAGVQNAAGVASAAALSYALTIGNNGGSPGVFGFSTVDSNPGAISPANSFKGVSFQRIRSSNVSEDLLITISTAGLAQSFWRRVVIQSTAGTWRSFGSADATSFSNAIITTWSFGTGSSPVFTSTTSPRGIIFFL